MRDADGSSRRGWFRMSKAATQRIRHVFAERAGLSVTTALAVYATICEHANDARSVTVIVSRSDLMAGAGIGAKAASRYVAELAAADVIEVKHRVVDGAHLPSVFTIADLGSSGTRSAPQEPTPSTPQESTPVSSSPEGSCPQDTQLQEEDEEEEEHPPAPSLREGEPEGGDVRVPVKPTGTRRRDQERLLADCRRYTESFFSDLDAAEAAGLVRAAVLTLSDPGADEIASYVRRWTAASTAA